MKGKWWLVVLAAILMVVLQACGNTGNPSKPSNPSVSKSTETTDADGTVTFASAKLKIQTRDLNSGQRISGLHVTLLDDGSEKGLVVIDPQGRYMPSLVMVDKLQQIQAQTGISLKKDAQGDKQQPIYNQYGVDITEITSKVSVNRPVISEYTEFYPKFIAAVESGDYNCTIESLGSLTSKTFWTGVIAGLTEGTELAVGAALDVSVVGTAAGVVITATDITNISVDTAAIGFDAALYSDYHNEGYAKDQDFKICVPKLPLDHLFFAAPVEKPRLPPVETHVELQVVGPLGGGLASDVEIKDSEGKTVFGMSLAYGFYELPGLPAGKYTFSASRFGYKPKQTTFTLTPGERKTVTLTLFILTSGAS